MSFYEKSKKEKTAVYISVIAVLLTAVTVLSVTLGIKTRKYNKISNQLSNSSDLLTDIRRETESYAAEIERCNAQIKELTDKIKAEKDTNASLEQQLKNAEAEKEKLRKELEKLKNQTQSSGSNKPDAHFQSILEKCQGLQSGKIPTDKVCYLTFDDGPSENTLKVIDILKRYNDIKATFFVVGTAKLDYLTNITEAGHTVALHTQTHRMQDIYINEKTYFDDLYAIDKNVQNKLGIKSRLIRFPGGSSNRRSKDPNLMGRLTKLVEEKGYRYFDWNVDSDDAGKSAKNSKAILSNVLSQAKNKKTICVLMHDTNAKDATVQALPAIIEGLISMDFRFESLTVNSPGFHHR